MKKSVIYILSYFVILLVLVGTYLRHSQTKIERAFRVTSSPWLSIRQNNLLSIDAGYTSDRQRDFVDQSFYIHWYGYKNDKYVLQEPMPSNGVGMFQFPEVPFDCVDCPFCSDLEMIWLSGEEVRSSKDTLEKYRLALAKTYCTAFGVDNTRGADMSHTKWFSEGTYNPRTEFEVYPLSAFVPGQRNEVLLVDIRDGVPYQGEIKVEQLNAPPGTTPQIEQANASGVTSLYFTLDSSSEFRITDGSESMNVKFNVNPQAFHVASDGYLILKEHEMPHVRITLSAPSSDFIIDYFVGYAWINRQIVPSSKLNDDIEIDPGYQFKTKVPEIVYALFHTQDNPNVQAIPFIATSYQRGYKERVNANSDDAQAAPRKKYSKWSGEHIAANMEFSAIYQDYVKLQKLNHIDLKDNFRSSYVFQISDLYQEITEIKKNSNLQERYGIFSVASVLMKLLQDQDSQTACIFSDECNQIRKYLLRNLGNIHRPEFKEITNSRNYVQPEFDANKREKMRHAMMMLAGWFVVGVVGFGAAARRIRIRRQEEFFDAAASGKKLGDLPSSPFWLKMVVGALGIGLLVSVYMMVSLL